MVRGHRPLLQSRTSRIVDGLGIAVWILLVLEALSLRAPLFKSFARFLAAQANLGAAHFTLGDVLLFLATVWAASLISRLTRFVLEEEVYPRVHLSAGLYYFISKMVHYSLLLAGFLAGLSLLGFNLSKLTILAGAFGVGLGFGLQNIVNNFVSGLILLFERPVKIGDIIQWGDTEGVVQHIGIRASVVRSANGSEIIVPNGKLISDPLTNWTFSNPQRLISIPLALAPNAEPQHAIELLQSVVAQHPQAAKQPASEVLFSGAAGGSLNFEVRAWTNHFQDWSRVRSDLALAISAVLAAHNLAVR